MLFYYMTRLPPSLSPLLNTLYLHTFLYTLSAPLCSSLFLFILFSFRHFLYASGIQAILSIFPSNFQFLVSFALTCRNFLNAKFMFKRNRNKMANIGRKLSENHKWNRIFQTTPFPSIRKNNNEKVVKYFN